MNTLNFNTPSIFNSLSDDLKKLEKYNYFKSGGKFTQKCEEWLKKSIGCKEALLVHSCTAALEMCAVLLDIKKNDEIIMPSYTFVSTANAFVLRDALPVFIDIDPTTCNIDPTKIEEAITIKTKAIVIVHYAGISCDMASILKIARKNSLILIEDAAQAILSYHNDKPLGSFGDFATLSFHETKNIHCGEGGALLINNPKFIERAKIVRDKGTNRYLFNQNMVKHYTWVDYGSSYGLNEFNAVILYSQLKKAKKITQKRLVYFKYYHKLLEVLEQRNFIKRPEIPKYAQQNGHIYYVILRKNVRDKLIKYLLKKNIYALSHYVPLHSSPFGKQKTKIGSTMKNTDSISQNLLRLPLHLKMNKKDIKRCTNEIIMFFKE